eukprot:Hpha_TRINITY_DN15511_c1_g1::TRINITY_DN15511_c1_g1_i4::g.103771::m.103771/K20168/TBC1D15; TBC1 domain family member 15
MREFQSSFHSSDILADGSKSVDSAPASSALSVESSNASFLVSTAQGKSLRFSLASDDSPQREKQKESDPSLRRVKSESARTKSVKQQFSVGTRVEVHSLVRRQELNGQTALIKAHAPWHDGQPCAIVVFQATEEKLKVKFANLKYVIDSPPSAPKTPPVTVPVADTNGTIGGGEEQREGVCTPVPVTPIPEEDRILLLGATNAQSFRHVAGILHREPQQRYSQDDVRTQGVRGLLHLLSDREREHGTVVWLPYCLAMTLEPGTLSAKARRSLGEMDDLPLCDDPDSFDGPFLHAWEQTCAVPTRRLLTIRKTGMLTKSLTLTCDSGSGTPITIGPFAFNDGGYQKFHEELGKRVRLERDPQDENLFTCDGHSDSVQSPPVTRSPSLKGSFRMKNDSISVWRRNDSNGLRAFPRGDSVATSPAPEKQGNSLAKFLNFSFRTASAGARVPPEPLNQSPNDSPRVEGDTPGVGTPQAELAKKRFSGIFERPKPEPLPEAPQERGPPLNREQWEGFFTDGVLSEENWNEARGIVFRGGVQEEVRAELWLYLLGVDEVGSTPEERVQRREELREEYAIYKGQWESITERQRLQFAKFRDRVHRIDKDVHRTDRNQELYSDDKGEGMTTLRKILITYAFFNFDLGYCQGMSDVVASLYFVLRDEVLSFWAFVHMMDTRLGSHFARDQRGMTQELSLLGSLVKHSDAELHSCLESADALNFFFCFRWCLVHFKREFPFGQVLCLWDVLWSCPFSSEWHLFVACTLLRISLAPQIQSRQMGYDDVLKFVNEMSGLVDLERALAWTAYHYDQMVEAVRATGSLAGVPGQPSLQQLLDAAAEPSPSRSRTPTDPAPGDDSPLSETSIRDRPVNRPPKRSSERAGASVQFLVDTAVQECPHLRLLIPETPVSPTLTSPSKKIPKRKGSAVPGVYEAFAFR